MYNINKTVIFAPFFFKEGDFMDKTDVTHKHHYALRATCTMLGAGLYNKVCDKAFAYPRPASKKEVYHIREAPPVNRY